MNITPLRDDLMVQEQLPAETPYIRAWQHMDAAHSRVAPLKGELEDKHRSFNQFVDTSTIQHALYRDYPDDL
jgi:hypothetical protein